MGVKEPVVNEPSQTLDTEVSARVQEVDSTMVTIMSILAYGETKNETAEFDNQRQTAVPDVRIRSTSYVRELQTDIRLHALGWVDSITSDDGNTEGALVFQVMKVFAEVSPDLEPRDCPLEGVFPGSPNVSRTSQPWAVIIGVEAGADKDTKPTNTRMRRIRITIR